MILNLVIYSILILLAYGITHKIYVSNRGKQLILAKKPFISIWVILLFAILFTLYNVFVTEQGINSNNISGDRLIYSLNFLGEKAPGTVGLKYLILFLKKFTDDSRWMFYGTTFICVLITFIAYRKTEATTPYAILFLVLTQWVFCTIINLKQCYCVAFATLFFVFALRESNLKNTLLCLLFIALACLFHQSGYILLFVFFVLKLFRGKTGSKKLLILCAIVFIFFVPWMQLLTNITASFLPSLSAKIAQYFNGNGVTLREGGMTLIKGFPFYYITFIGFLRQNKVANKINFYYPYLNISIITSLSYLLAFYNEWMFRLVYLFYFPVSIFFGQIILNNQNRTERTWDLIIVLGSSFVILYRYIILMYVNYGGFSGVL